MIRTVRVADAFGCAKLVVRVEISEEAMGPSVVAVSIGPGYVFCVFGLDATNVEAAHKAHLSVRRSPVRCPPTSISHGQSLT